ncbi:UDP-N-acetylmuramoyl-tripeptide--D-alanyl-D-alanine ligase [Actinomadura kijaniata]|uniref:UDP-N-acetylmuramoyl-tripeptide--D-alanyl-D-alanine ligase n=1 Tax=Actinomadura namibiensis TaxID=182080 RepID=A0A7W3LYK5_ACTNM|nr:UDP-N-acetylmuramoyl-tripeptide--D-alanyl-D-alanine ligase [Actinomadura namibiensis]MBA8956557.1 UDP-N-acetylmuramoyl-tripeptide--D-alanyl-D-alanine ligase [Actinomadura namibiensis]
MIPMTLTEIASVTGGRLDAVPDPDSKVTAPAAIDSRLVQPGGLFAALPGEHVDGHDYAAQAVAAGAAAVMTTRPVGVPAVIVDDVTAAMGRLASAVAARLTDTTAIALTGSSGKTSTKDLLLQVLQHDAPTVATDRSFNNEIGLPLTVLRAEPTTRYLVLEMGARHAGHIAYLTRLVPPHIGLVLNVGTAHIGEFGGRHAIAAAKGELVEALPSTADGGLAILNADDDLVAAMHTRTKAVVATFGRAPHADVRATDVHLDHGRARFTLTTPLGSALVTLQVLGEHQVSNALAAAAVAHGVGMAPTAIADALSNAQPLSSGRLEVLERPDGVVIINDAFNANIDSMTAGLRSLVSIADSRRAIAVLGEMRELGDDTTTAHAEVGRLAAALGIDLLIAVGTTAAAILAESARETRPDLPIEVVPDRHTAYDILHGLLKSGDTVLIKASHALHLDELAIQLAKEA